MQAVIHIARFTWLETRRGRQPWLIAGVMALAMLGALFAADLALTDSASYRSGVYAGLVRVTLVFLTMLLVATGVAREQEERRLELSLSRPLSRAEWYGGRLLGHGVVALIAGLGAGLPLFALAPAAASLIWTLSFAVELALVAAATLAIIVTLRQVTTCVLAVAAFYLLARAMPAIVLMSTGPTVDPAAWSSALIARFVGVLALLLPDLAACARADWLFGAAPLPALGPLLLDGVIAIVLFSAVGLIDLARRNDL